MKLFFGDLSIVLIMLLLGACCGLALNQLRENPLPLVYAPKASRIQQAVAVISADTLPRAADAAANATSGPAALHYIELAAVREGVEKKASGLVLDARPEFLHRLGHIPGALSLPREEFETGYGQLRSLLERNKQQMITVYCSNSGCEDSEMVAEALVKLDYTNVHVFKGGWSDWTQAHLPEETAQ